MLSGTLTEPIEIKSYKCPIEKCGIELGSDYEIAYEHCSQQVIETKLPLNFVLSMPGICRYSHYAFLS